MRIRIPFATAFLILLLLSAYLGLTSYQIPSVNDKVLHFTTFFILTVRRLFQSSITSTLRLRPVAALFLLDPRCLASSQLEHLPSFRYVRAWSRVRDPTALYPQ